MNGDLTVYSAAAPLLAVDEAKSYLRVTHTADDYDLVRMIAATTAEAEEIMGRALARRTYDLTLDAWPTTRTLALPMPPLVSVTSVTYTDTDGASTVFSSAGYIVNTAASPGLLVLKTGYDWPSVTLRESAAIVVRYVAGYEYTAIPLRWKHLVAALLSIDFENRDSLAADAARQREHIVKRLMADRVYAS